MGVVTAIDITNDPAHNVVSHDIAETLRKSKDSRIKYVISDAQIFNNETWKWRRYLGSNPHRAHCHISVRPVKALYDKVTDWPLPPALGGEPEKPVDHIADAVSLGDMAHQGEFSERTKKIQEALDKAGIATVVDGDFGPLTEASVRTFQRAKGLEIDGIVGPATAVALDEYLQETPPPPLKITEAGDWQSGRGSWYAQYEGRYKWRDPGDKPGSAALGVPDSAQGVSFLNNDTLGKWFEIEYPNGHRSIEQQTDIGPSRWTGKKIDISAAAAERAGYSPNNFPTGAVIKWRQIDPPDSIKSLPPRLAAVKYRDERTATA
jgi:hypothetical protein